MMQVNNKFNIGDKVYFIDSNSNMKAKCDEITGVFIYVRKEIFASESDLKDYVFKDLIEFV